MTERDRIETMHGNIERAAQWTRGHREWIFFWCAVVLCFAMSFGVGYFIGAQGHATPIVIQQNGH